MTDNPEHEQLELGHEHKASWIVNQAGERIGVLVDHPSMRDGTPCGGGIQWRGTEWQEAHPDEDVSKGRWDLHSIEPLTLSPSLLCVTCGDHGFIRDGKWVPA